MGKDIRNVFTPQLYHSCDKKRKRVNGMNCYFENGICVMTPMSNEEWTSKVSKAFNVSDSQVKAGNSEEMPVFQMEKLSRTEGCLNE